MNQLRFLVLFACLSLCAACATSRTPQAATNTTIKTVNLDATLYRLASGDTIRVDVLGEADLSLQLILDPAGYINYPFLGRIQAAGQTMGQLEKRIHDGLKAGFLVNPDVRIAIVQYRPIYVSGQVRQAGAYTYSLGLTVDKALTLAGGMTPFGSSSRIYLQRAGQSKQQRENVGLDSLVYPGDTIVVEERLF